MSFRHFLAHVGAPLAAALVIAALLLAACAGQPSPAPTATPTSVPRASASLAVSATADGFQVTGADWPGLTELTLGLEPSAGQAAPIVLGKATTTSQGSFRAAFAWAALAGRWQPAVAYDLVALAPGREARVAFALAPPTNTPTPLVMVTATTAPTATPTSTPTPTTPAPATETPTPTQTPTPTATSPPPTVNGPTPTPWPVALAVAPLKGWAGTAVTISGVNWPPGRGIVLNLAAPGQAPAADVYAQAAVNVQGRFTFSFSFPNQERWLALKQVALVVRTLDNTAQARAAFELVRPAPTVTPTPRITEWRGEYFANRNLDGTPALRGSSVTTARWISTGARAARAAAFPLTTSPPAGRAAWRLTRATTAFMRAAMTACGSGWTPCW